MLWWDQRECIPRGKLCFSGCWMWLFPRGSVAINNRIRRSRFATHVNYYTTSGIKNWKSHAYKLDFQELCFEITNPVSELMRQNVVYFVSGSGRPTGAWVEETFGVISRRFSSEIWIKNCWKIRRCVFVFVSIFVIWWNRGISRS